MFVTGCFDMESVERDSQEMWSVPLSEVQGRIAQLDQAFRQGARVTRWRQERVDSGEIRTEKRKREHNTADFGSRCQVQRYVGDVSRR